MYINLTWSCRVYVGVAFLCLLCALLPGLITLKWIDQQHFAKTRMGCISLTSNLNAIIGIASYYCVILKMVILHDAMKHFRMGYLFFLKKWQKTVSFQKNKNIRITKKQVGCFFKKRVILNLDCHSIFCVISFDRTIWYKSHHYQCGWVCAAHLEYRSLVVKNLIITDIWIRKN